MYISVFSHLIAKSYKKERMKLGDRRANSQLCVCACLYVCVLMFVCMCMVGRCDFLRYSGFSHSRTYINEVARPNCLSKSSKSLTHL